MPSQAFITAPATDAAKRWHGWGTALKPALEPITLARKPLRGTVAANVVEHGTGALNVEACRVEASDGDREDYGLDNGAQAGIGYHGLDGRTPYRRPDAGRWPANLIHDGSEDVERLTGSAARFFYCAKASQRERGEGNSHPTVKPVALMRYLCRLVTPPGGLVLDPFAGSGTTGIAAKAEGFRFLGIEREPQYVEIARRRCAHAAETRQPELFDEVPA
jgi:site-specific DNA-methyltransferase (adenine-specific)